MAANGSGTMAFIDDFTADRSNRMDVEVYSRGAFCVLTYRHMHQNSLEHISSFSRTTIMNIQPKTPKGEEVEYPQLAESVT